MLPGISFGEPPPPSYHQLRYEENYTFLRDPPRSADVWDPLKYIPLDKEGEWYLSLGGEIRLKYEYFRNANWGQGPQDSNGYLLQRYMFHSDLHLAQHARIFGQIKSGIEGGRKGGPRPTDEDKLDLHQAFLDVGDTPVTLRFGRQELAYGSSRLVSVRESPNVRQSFDGARVILKSERWRVDAFGTKPVETKRNTFDDGTDNSRTFWGVYAVGPLAALPWAKADLYYLGLDRDDARFDQGTAKEVRHSVGTRLWGEADGWDFNVEFVYQWGRFGSGRIRAWTAASDTGYTIRSMAFSPRIALKADIASGDRNLDDKDIETFNALFPKGAYFGEAALIGPANLIDLRPSVTLTTSERISFTLEYGPFWRQSVDDGIYGPAINLLRSGRLSRARHIGNQLLAEVEWKINRHTSVTVHYTCFSPGAFLKETPPAGPVDYVTTWIAYRF